VIGLLGNVADLSACGSCSGRSGLYVARWPDQPRCPLLFKRWLITIGVFRTWRPLIKGFQLKNGLDQRQFSCPGVQTF